jgi:glycosyltransferase involved in cell wall biosynthesis
VAVFMVTYNHESFIARSIESVLYQNTTFEFQLFIGEDGSMDNTRYLCQQYADQYPHRVRLFSREKNIGVFENANLLFEACLTSGAKYIAMLEGDDCWISNDKLQQQITYLEQHDDCAGSYHNTDFLYANGDRKVMFKKLPERMILDDVIGKYSPFHTTSFVFRSKHFCRPTWFKEIHSVDLAMYIWHAQFGYFKGFNETWSFYRIHDSGMTAGKDHNEYFHQKRLMLYQMMNGKIVQPFNDKLNDLIQYHLSQMGSLKVKEMKKILFFDTKEDFESQILKMNIEAEILPFHLKNGICNGFFNSFKLTSIKWFNAIQLRWQYRKYWVQVKAVVFLSSQDANQFNLVFSSLNLPYLILDEKDSTVHSANVINTQLLNL